MKIRTLLIMGFLALAFTPLLLFIGLNMPRVLSQFKTADETKQLLLIQRNAHEINMTLKWDANSLKSLSDNMGAIELAGSLSSDLSQKTLHERVGKMVVRWYQDYPEVSAIQLFNQQGTEQFVVRREQNDILAPFPPSSNTIPPPSLLNQADIHSSGDVYISGFDWDETTGTKQYPVMFLGVVLKKQDEYAGFAVLSIDLSHLLKNESGRLAIYNKRTNRYGVPGVSNTRGEKPLLPPGLLFPAEATLIKDQRGEGMAVVPIFTNEHSFENVLFTYPVEISSTMVWVDKWRKQVLMLFGTLLLCICFAAIKISMVLDRFVKELLSAFQDLLHQKKAMNFPCSGPDEVQKLSLSLNTLSLQYLESLHSQERMLEKTKEMENELRQSQKMKAIGLLAGGVAHDLNNILSGIVSYPQLLLLQLPEDNELRGPILEIQRSGERAAAVVADLLTVARGVASKKECADLNTLIQEYFDSPEHKAQKKNYQNVFCSVNLSEEGLPIICSPVHVKKTLMNLMINAAESIPAEGEIIVKTKKVQFRNKDILGSNLAPGSYALLQIKDTGPGIAEKDLEHIFEPFYSKKKMGRSGTGLGLTVVWNTMNDHEGRVKVMSGKEGSCFELYFPLYLEEQNATPEKTEKIELQGNGEHILIIDDEALQRDLGSRILGLYGYHVDTVASGEEAVQFLRDHECDLLLLDMIMEPGMDGYATYQEIVKIRPQQKAIIATGFSASEAVEKTQKLGAGVLLKKPYSPEDLALAVKNALQQK